MFSFLWLLIFESYLGRPSHSEICHFFSSTFTRIKTLKYSTQGQSLLEPNFLFKLEAIAVTSGSLITSRDSSVVFGDLTVSLN